MKRNKKYKPKSVVQNPLNYFFGGLKKINDEFLTDLNIKNHAALLNMTINGTKDDFDKLAGMVNMTLVLTEIHYNDQYRELIIEARDALSEIGKRYLKIKTFVMTGDERRAIENTIEIHEAQLKDLRVIDIERGYDEIQRRIKHNVNTVRIVDETLTIQA